MSEVTRVLAAIERGDPQAASRLLPLVYEELRRLAARKMANEPAGQTLNATALGWLSLGRGESMVNFVKQPEQEFYRPSLGRTAENWRYSPSWIVTLRRS